LHAPTAEKPYSLDYLRDEVLAIAERESAEAAEKRLEEVANDFPKQRLSVLRGRAYLAAGHPAEAERLLAEIDTPADADEDLFEECLQVKIAIALENNSQARVLALCDEGLARWPDSTRLKEIQAEQLAEDDPARSQELLRDVLHNGEPQLQTVWQYLGVAGQAGDAAARDAILAAPEDRRENLAVLFSEVMGHHELVRWNAPYLQWAQREFPDADALRWRLLNHYNINGQVKKAVTLAKEIHQRNPQNPEAVRMLGRCLIDHDARKALPYLEEACQQDRSADYLFDLARCHQVIGDAVKSKLLHWEILEQNPYMSSSWTNLYLLGNLEERLWPYLAPMLERGCGVDDEYFLVAAVKLAIDRQEALPSAWFPLACRRWEILRTHPGFDDERPRLQRALLAWQSKRANDGDGQQSVPRNFVESLIGRYWWPRHSWVPAE